MLEHIDLTKHVSRAEYKRQLPELQSQLYEQEKAVFERAIPVSILFEGWAAADKGSTIRVLTSRLDPRGFRVVPISSAKPHEQTFPWLHRFWLKLPNFGQIAIFNQSWYRRLLIDRVEKRIPKHEWKQGFNDIRDFERTLADDGMVIIKFFLHISKKEQAKRFRRLLTDPITAWQVNKEERFQQKHYDKYLEAIEEMLGQTEAEWAPWTIVEATDRNHTRFKVLQTIISSLTAAVESHDKKKPRSKNKPARIKDA
jgi:polyphosphate kinase 2 (PPK2 family)